MANGIEEWAIFQLAARLAQAADDRDLPAYQACLADAIWTGSPGEAAPIAADTYARDAMRRLAGTRWTHHKLCNPVIDIDADGRRASASIDVVVTARRVADTGAPARSVFGGRYLLGLIRTERGWRIERRRLAPRYSYDEIPLPAHDPAAEHFTIDQGADHAHF